jgi:hypothetical protein
VVVVVMEKREKKKKKFLSFFYIEYFIMEAISCFSLNGNDPLNPDGNSSE